MRDTIMEIKETVFEWVMMGEDLSLMQIYLSLFELGYTKEEVKQAFSELKEEAGI